MSGAKPSARAVALALYSSCRAAEKYANLALSSHLTDLLSASDRALASAIFYTAVERSLTCEYLTSALSGRPKEKLRAHTLDLLTVGLAQLLFMDHIPAHAAVNETVALAEDPGERAFVNAILREALRRRDKGDLPYPPREKNPARYLSVRYSFPLAVVRRFLSLLGEEDTEATLAFFDRTAPLTVAVNLAKTTRENYLEILAANGFSAEPTARSPIGIRFAESVRPTSLPGFDDGLFYVQDEASQLAALAASPKASSVVVDVCSAPGGKSFAVSSLTHGSALVHAFDLHASKLPLISSGAERLGFANISVQERDALTPDPALAGEADLVLCDVPCSGLGVLGKKPDLRYKDLSAAERLPDLQLAILEASLSYLKPGGRLLYSTCTLDPRENAENIARFLAAHPEFSRVSFRLADLDAPDGCLTLLPHRHGTDGFFISLLQKGNL